MASHWDNSPVWEEPQGGPAPIFEEPVEILATQNEIKNLRRKSRFYNGLMGFGGRDSDCSRAVVVKTPPGLTQGLCVYLTAITMLGTTQLPNFEVVGVTQFTMVCLYYGFDHLLWAMSRHCVRHGIKYCLPFVRVLMDLTGPSEPLITAIRFSLSKLWLQAEAELRDPYPVSLDKFQSPVWYRRIVRTITHSAFLRAEEFYPVCPYCYTYVVPDERAELMPCCLEPVHRACRRATTPCAICGGSRQCIEACDHSRFPWIDRMNDLRDAKLYYWLPCMVHDGCYVYYKGECAAIVHKTPQQLQRLIESGINGIRRFSRQYALASQTARLVCLEEPPDLSSDDGWEDSDDTDSVPGLVFN